MVFSIFFSILPLLLSCFYLVVDAVVVVDVPADYLPGGEKFAPQQPSPPPPPTTKRFLESFVYSESNNILSKRQNFGTASKNDVPMGTPLFARRESSPSGEWCVGTWHGEIRYPGMPNATVLWSGTRYEEIKDYHNQKVVVKGVTPFGQIGQWTSPQGSWQYNPLDPRILCTYEPSAVFQGYLELARNSLVKTGNLPNHVDIYTGLGFEPLNAYTTMSKQIFVDSRTGATLYEEWTNKNGQAKNLDGSCPPSLVHFAGHIVYNVCEPLADVLSRHGKQAEYQSFLEMPPACSTNSPSLLQSRCWDSRPF